MSDIRIRIEKNIVPAFKEIRRRYIILAMRKGNTGAKCRHIGYPISEGG